MIAFEITANGEKVCTAGVGKHGVLSAILSWVGRDAPVEAVNSGRQWPAEELKLEVGGLVGNAKDGHENLKWMSGDLRPGDVITIRVLETDTADQPRVRKREDPDLVEKSKRAYYEQLRM
jgi:hypothetical protein